MTENNQNVDSDVPEELTSGKKTKDIEEQKAEEQLQNEISKSDLILSAIGYIGFLCILPLVLRKDSAYCQHHAHQALVIAIGVYFLDTLNAFPTFFVSIYTVLKYGIVFYSIYMALKGEKHKLPFIFGISERFRVTLQ